MHRTLRLVSCLGLWAIFDAGAALGCSCSSSPPPLEALARADMVFIGRVLAREEPPPQTMLYDGEYIQVISTGDMIAWRMLIESGWKGEPSNAVTIYSMRDGASCGIRFRLGERYLVYVSWMERAWWAGQAWPPNTVFPALGTFLCDRTRSLERAGTDLAELGEPAWTNDARPPLLHMAGPSPSRGTALFRYETSVPGRVRLAIYDAAGRRVAVVTESVEASGGRTAEWNGRDDAGRRVAAGTYFARLEATGTVVVRKFVWFR